MVSVLQLPHGFCRDCLAAQAREAPRCTACGSPRVLRHSELDALSIAHVDCDAFYAAVEKRDRPELRDQPVIIGGGKRGVVSTACYIARIHGVKSAMPMFKALALCPQAVVIKPDMEKYARVGREVRDAMLRLTPLVEPLSIDEAFLDLSGTARVHGAPPALVLGRFARDVERDIGISVSIGLSYCKFLAKIASDMKKPRGFAVIGRAEARSFLAGQPVGLIWGVGKAFGEALNRDGIRIIGQLQTMEISDLTRRYGVMGARLYHLSRGEDDRRVDPSGEAKSVSAETTFDEDIGDFDTLVVILRELAEKVSRRLKRAGIAGRTVTLKLKTADFKSRTRAHTLADPTQLADRIHCAGIDLLKRETDGTLFRLVGIGVSDLSDPKDADPRDLVDTAATRRALAEAAMDDVRARFGNRSVETGITYGRGRKARPQRERE